MTEKNTEVKLVERMPYQGAYHADLENEDDEALATPEQDPNENEDEATSDDEPLNPEEKTFKKRYGDLRAHTNKALSEKEREIAKLREQLTEQSPQITPPTSPEALNEWRQKYPEAYDIVETIAMQNVEKLKKAQQDKLKELEVQLAESTKREAWAVLKARHPDIDDIVNSDQFHVWAEAQPTEIQNMIYENTEDGERTAYAVGLYKKEYGLDKPKATEAKKRKQSAKDASKDVNVKDKSTPDAEEKKIWTLSEIARLKPHQFEAQEEEIDLAHREGRIVDDAQPTE